MAIAHAPRANGLHLTVNLDAAPVILFDVQRIDHRAGLATGRPNNKVRLNLLLRSLGVLLRRKEVVTFGDVLCCDL